MSPVRQLLYILISACVVIQPVALAYRIWDFDPDEVPGFKVGEVRGDIVLGKLVIDPPTLENLGFRWFVEGDSNENATVQVAYRRVGEKEWQEAMPMLRIHHEIAARYQDRHFRTPNLFAGSVFSLKPGTKYEVQFSMHDPDGGAPEDPVIVSVSTRSEPDVPSDGRTLHVFPENAQQPALIEDGLVFEHLMLAYAEANPGDVIYLHEGTHNANDAPYILTRSGTVDRPIVFRGAGAGRTVIEGPDNATDIFQLLESDFLMFEHLTIRTAHTAIRTGLTTGISIEKNGPGVNGLTVRNCHIEQVINGVWTSTENSQNWYLADNVITGIDEEWYPRSSSGYMDGAHTGVNVYGQGHIVCFNRISHFSDSLAIANYHPPPMDIHKQAVNIDFYNNDLSFAMDNTIEADYGCHNIRVYNNLNYNTHQALSIQPSYGGPVYLIRNIVFGVGNALKFSMVPSGPVAYHNTLLSSGGRGFSSEVWGNGHLRNNLFLGLDSMIRTGTVTPHLSTMDYNGWYGDVEKEEVQIRWTLGEKDTREYTTLAEFTADTGLEANGVEIDYSIFIRADFVERGRTYTRDAFDLRLVPEGGAVNIGMRLPNINDNFTGTAPDLGAYEAGHDMPQYGPRNKSSSI